MVAIISLVCVGVGLLDLIYLGGMEGSRFSGALALSREDGLVETLSAAAYLIGFVTCALILVRGPRTLIIAAWMVLCLLCLGEETSWFQRIIGYNVSAVEQVNAQGEFNLHDLPGLAGVGWRDVDSAESFMRVFFGSQNLFQMGFAFFFLLLPTAALFKSTRPLLHLVGYCRPPDLFLWVLWSLVALSYVQVGFVVEPLHKDAIVEARELLFAVAILAYALLLTRPVAMPADERRTRQDAPAIARTATD
jgi:hypothetical protein